MYLKMLKIPIKIFKKKKKKLREMVPESLGMKSCEMVDKLQALKVIWSAEERGKSLLVLECQ